MNTQDMMMLIARIIILFIAFPIHETAHAFVAYKLGDPTAKSMGRIALSPLNHIRLWPTVGMMVLASISDVTTHNYTIGNMILLLTSILFFKAVPIDTRYFRNRKAGMALTALAGPMSNVLLGIIFLILYKFCVVLLPNNTVFNAIVLLISSVVSINLQLAAFNLLPVPPLDGSKVLGFFLSDKINYMMQQYSRYIMFGMLILLYLTPIFDYVVNFIYKILLWLINFATGWVDLLLRAFL